MIIFADTPPSGDFMHRGLPMTLKEVALALFEYRDLCLQGCSRWDLPALQLVTEPYSYDIVFVAMPACRTGDVYFVRKTTIAPAEGQPAAPAPQARLDISESRDN